MAALPSVAAGNFEAATVRRDLGNRDRALLASLTLAHPSRRTFLLVIRGTSSSYLSIPHAVRAATPP